MNETQANRIAKTPRPPYYVVTTTTHLGPGYEQQVHLSWGKQLHEIASQMDGFLGLEVFFDGDFSCASSYWRDLSAIEAWRNHPSHKAAKNKAKADWFGPTITRISRVERDYGFDLDTKRPAL